VSFALPKDAAKTLSLSFEGKPVPLQVSAGGTATFLVPRQRAGEAISFSLAEGEAAAAPGVEVAKAGGQLDIKVGGKPALGYKMDKEALPRPEIAAHYKRAGYLHPVLSPSGKQVTGDFHPRREHHHGIWTPWTKTYFQGRTPDFWNTHQNKATVEFAGLDWTWSGPVHGGFVARHMFMDNTAATPVAALHEIWEVTIYNAGPDVRLFDLLLTQVCATNDPLKLPEYHYGGTGLRGNSTWIGRDLPKILTSEGEKDRIKAHTTKIRWLHIGGPLGDGETGIAMMGHPGNFRAPQPIRVAESEPFFCFAPSQGGDWAIEPGKPYVARYRFVVADGAPDRAQLDAYWNAYAQPAVVKVEAVP
jgi:hypothetical protein